MMTGTMTALMWLMMSLMPLGSAIRGITWARRRRRGGGLSAPPISGPGGRGDNRVRAG